MSKGRKGLEGRKGLPRLPRDASLVDENYPLLRKVIAPIHGNFTKWKVGEMVRACKHGRTFSIRKLKLNGYSLPLNSACCNIPASSLAIP